jgi:serine/threonine protein kinase
MLAVDTLLGPYKIVAPIGAGGMGEVYRAVDTRLGREVAVKVLSSSISRDAEALQRFEQEARASGMLNHPNIVALYDIGSEGEVHYIVSELLEGESVRARIRQGPIPARKAADYASQIARGLAAAHAKGIIHRDLKPENLFITRDGQVKILDFGLAKLVRPLFGGNERVDDDAPTLPASPTEPGRILGTVGYMAPEQIRGNGGDHRSDIFSFGSILFEMLTGRPAFRGESPIETLNSILKDEPPEFYDLDIRVPPALERAVRHCLEKNPEERFQTARDLAFDLGAISGLTSRALSYRMFPRVRIRRLVVPIALLLMLALAIGAGYLLGEHHGSVAPATFKRLTFRSGSIFSARFAPDGETVFYGASWMGKPFTVFSTRSDSPESRDLGFGTSDLLSISSTGQMALSLGRHPIGYLRFSGTLAQAALSGGAPREILEDVEAADWSPDGKALAIVRTLDGACQLEYPIGKVLYRTIGWISNPRFSPEGDAIAFLDHPFLNDDRGTISIVDLAGHKSTVGHEWQSVAGLAWWPDGKELWLAAEQPGTGRALHAVSRRNGRERLITTSAGPIALQDIGPDGRVLVTQETLRAGILAQTVGDIHERDLSWLDFSAVRDISNDGKTILFSESGQAGGAIYGVYVRSIDGSPAIRLGDGTSEALSPDGRWVLSIPRNQKPAQIVMLPTRAGQPRAITHDAISHRNARWFPDGSRILFQGNQPNRPTRVWVQNIDGSAPRPITPENVTGGLLTPDGREVLVRSSDRKYYFYPVDGGEPRQTTAVHGGDVPVRFSSDGKTLYAGTFGKIPALLYHIDLASGERTIWREAVPDDAAGLISVGPILVTPDGETSVYSYTRYLTDLYLVEVAEK